MKFDYYLAHLYQTQMGRREAMRAAAQIGMAVGAAGALAAVPPAAEVASAQSGGRLGPEPINDAPFDAAAVERGAWAPGPYGAGDQRGSWNEVTSEKTAAAWRLLDGSRPIKTYNLGDLMSEGYPAFPSAPNERIFRQTLVFGGMEAPAGIIQLNFGNRMPAGINRVTYMEERLETTYQIATQLDGLNHIGVGDMYYNGYRASEIARPNGTTALGNEHMGPIVTRGIVLDIVGLKRAQGQTSALFTAPDGGTVLQGSYRITVEDMQAAMAREGIAEPGPGDVVLFRTGWGHLRGDPERYLMTYPGIFLREARWLAARRPAIVGSDTWGLETLNPEVTGMLVFPVHQVLLTRNGIRIGEGMITEDLVEDGIFEFVFIVTPQYSAGSTAGNTPPAALGQPRATAPKK